MNIKDCKNSNTILNDINENLIAAQDKLNAVVSMCDVNEQLKNYKVNKDALLYNTPIALKDNVSTKDIRTTASSKILDNYLPVYDATVVEKLREAGAIFAAKTSMDELGMGGTNLNAYTGKVNNPYDVNRISGGSSGGSAALVAEGIVPLAIGTDTGDSIRKPAAYCGVVGLKPTYGRISRYGVIPYASSLDHVGVFSTTVSDAAIALEAIAGRDDKDMTTSSRPVEKYSELLNSNITGKKIGIIKNVQEHIDNEEVLKQFEKVVDGLRKRGAIVEEVVFDDKLMHALLPTYRIIANAEAIANHSNLDGIRFGIREDGENLTEIMMNSRTKGIGSLARKRFIIGSYSLFIENQEKIFRKAQKVRRLIVNELEAKMQDYDILLASASSDIAPLPSELEKDQLKASFSITENHMLLGNFSGYPSITLPNGFVNDMPIGVNLLAKPFEEVTMFSVAKAIEEETGLEGLCRKGSK